MQGLIGATSDENISIVADNAVLPSLAFLSCSRKCNQRNIMRTPLHSWRPKLNRYYSEPIKYDTFLQAPRVSSRWSCGLDEAPQKDKLLNVPKRAASRWSVARMHSDSVLISPKRSTGMPVFRAALSTLHRKLSTSKLRFEVANERTILQQSSPLFEADESDAGEADLQQQQHHVKSPLLFTVHNERTKQEPIEQTARSAIELPKRESTENTRPEVTSQPSDADVAMFFVIGCIFKIIETEIVGPALFDSANQLLNMISVNIQLTDDGKRTGGYHSSLYSLKHEHQGASTSAP
jgi:hypothetical protein